MRIRNGRSDNGKAGTKSGIDASPVIDELYDGRSWIVCGGILRIDSKAVGIQAWLACCFRGVENSQIRGHT